MASNHRCEAKTVVTAASRKTRPAAPSESGGFEPLGSEAGQSTGGPAAAPTPDRDGHLLDAACPCG